MHGSRKAMVAVLVLSSACVGAGGGRTDTTAMTLGDGESGDVTGTSSMGDASTSGTIGDGTGSTGTVPGEPPDLAAGMWTFDNVSKTPAMSLHGNRVVLDDGHEVVAWTETDLGSLSVLNVLAATGSEGNWETAALTAYDDVQNTYPAMAASDDVALLVWMGRTTTQEDYDVYLAKWAGAWSTATSVTAPLQDPMMPQDDGAPAVVATPGDGIAVAYTAEDPGTIGEAEVFVTQFTVNNSPATRTSLVSPAQGSCDDLVAGISGTGALHVVARCNVDGSSRLLHATNRSGQWKTDALGGTTTGILSPAMASAGGEVHLVWIQDAPCGADTCDDTYYAVTSDDVFGTPINVTQSANLDERLPAVGVDPFGRVIVLSQVRIDGLARIDLSISDDGASFAPAFTITPSDTQDDYQTPSDLAFTEKGYPSFVLEVAFADSDPLNLDIFVGRFQPG